MNNQLFRKSSLDQLQSPDQLDQLLTVTSLRSWIALVGTAVLIIAIIIWSFVGSLPVNIYGQGMLISSGGIQQILGNENGEITDISLKPGDVIEEGEVVARLQQPELLEQIRSVETELEMTSEDNEVQKEILQKKLATLQNELYLATRVVSPFSGKVVEVKAKRGEFINRGAPILSMERTGEQLRELGTVLYVSAQDGKKIHPGMEVKIEPASILKEDHGYLLGKVIEVADFPATFQGMMDTIGNEEIVAALLGEGGAPIQVKISLVPDQKTESGYKWTSLEGPPISVQSGTLASGMITIEDPRPISKVFPQLK